MSTATNGAAIAPSTVAPLTEFVDVELRYRPLGDVLLVDVPALTAASGSWVESSDADIDIRCTALSGRATITAVRVVHARARWRADPAAIPLAALLGLDSLFSRADRTVADSLAARARTVVTAQVQLPLSALVSRGGVAPVDEPDAGSLAMAQGLVLVAESIDSAAGFAGPHDAARTGQLVAALRELADVVRRHGGRPAPGTTIAALRLVSGGLPLCTTERIRLRSALDRSLDRPAWPEIAVDLQALAEHIAPWLHSPALRDGP